MIDNSTVLFEDSPLTELPGTIVGYRTNGKPIYNIAGGAADVETGSDDDDDDTDDSDDNDEDSDDEWTPPSREEWQKVLDAKKKADSEAAQRKRWLRDNGFDPKTGKRVEKPSVKLEDVDDTEDSDDVIKKPETTKESGFDREKFEAQFQRQLDREVAKAERQGRVSAYALIHEVPAALEEAGWNGKNLARMTRLLELDDLEIDEDGIDAETLSNKVASLKKDFPEFFKRSRMKDAAKEIADTGAVGGGKKQAPASEEDLDWKARMKLQLTRPSN